MIKKMTPKDASRIQSTNAKKNGGVINKGTFTSRAQKAATTNRPPNGPSTTGNSSGKGRGNNPPRK